jgi:rhodanese-related sulfurtransferase
MRTLWRAVVFLGLMVPGAVTWANGTQADYAGFLDSLYDGTVPVVDPDIARSRIESNRDILLLDVRSEPERTVSFIAGSEFVDFGGFSMDAYLGLPRNTPVIAYCAVGYRSERVGEAFIAAGFTDVSHLYGGIIEWHNRGLPLQAGEGGASEVGPGERGAAVPSAAGPPVHGYRPRWGRYVADGNVTYEPPVE